MRYQFFFNFFHLVKSVSPYEWENTQEQKYFGLLTKHYMWWTTLGSCLLQIFWPFLMIFQNGTYLRYQTLKNHLKWTVNRVLFLLFDYGYLSQALVYVFFIIATIIFFFPNPNLYEIMMILACSFLLKCKC